MIKYSLKIFLPIIIAIIGLTTFFHSQNTFDKFSDNVQSSSAVDTNYSDDIPEDYIEISNNCRYTGMEFNEKKLLTVENLIPTSEMPVDIYNHKYFIIGYSNKHKQSAWCAWLLTKYMVRNKNVKRENVFREDTSLKCCLAYNSDYNRSGYDRGHLCPSGDMTWSKQANRETFLLSNICPQHKKLNQGRWNDLEILSRAWASKNDSLIIITGPILEPIIGTIGKNKVSVPSAFYKILIDISSPKCKAIAFIMPNQAIKERIFTYAVSIKDVEKKTKLNFFPNFDKNVIIQSLERMCDTTEWK